MNAMREYGEQVDKKCTECGVDFKISKLLTSFKMCEDCTEIAEKKQKEEEEEKRIQRINAMSKNISDNYIKYLGKVGFNKPMLEEYSETEFNPKLSKCIIAGETKKSLDGVDAMLDNAIAKRTDIVIHGFYGTGKTRIISHLIHRLLIKFPYSGDKINYINCQIEDTKLHYLGMDRQYSMEQMVDSSILILDEVEKIKHDYFGAILVERLNDRKRNILIGNFNQKSFKEVYGSHIFSRLARAFWIEIVGDDQRFVKCSSNQILNLTALRESK